MNSQNMVTAVAHTAGDLLDRYLMLFGNDLFSPVVAWTILVLGVVLIASSLLGTKVLLQRLLRLVSIPAPPDDQRLYASPLFVAEEDAPRHQARLSPDLEDFCRSLKSAVADLAEERRGQADRILMIQDRMHTVLLKIEGAMAGIKAIADRDSAQAASIDLRLDALHETMADLGRRLTETIHDHEPQFPSRLPAAKISAEIAEIVRELQAG